MGLHAEGYDRNQAYLSADHVLAYTNINKGRCVYPLKRWTPLNRFKLGFFILIYLMQHK